MQLPKKFRKEDLVKFISLQSQFCDEIFVTSGGIPRIKKANAEEFIHIFVNNSEKLTEFLEHMVKVSECECLHPHSSVFILITSIWVIYNVNHEFDL